MKKIFLVLLFIASVALMFGANNCLDFDGNDFVNCGSDASLKIGGDLTMSAWINFDSNNAVDRYILNNYDTAANGKWIMLLTNDTGPRIEFAVDDGSTVSRATYPLSNIDTGTWYHVVGVRDYGTSLKLYVNGEEVGSGVDNTGDSTSNKDFYIGQRSDTGGLYFDGLLDNVRIYNRVLTGSEVSDLYDNEASGPTNNLVAHWTFDEGGTSQITYDETTNDNDGTLGSSSGTDDNDPSWVSSDAPLPVTLSSFSAQYIAGSPILNWSTQSETDNMGWNVYRSTVGNMEQSMILNVEGMIEGAGTTSEPTDYSYRDEHNIIFNVTYWYWLESISISGDAELFGPITLTTPYNDPNSNSTPIPIEYGLFQNYPNPFNPSTEISFMLAVDSRVELSIYDIEGRKVITLLDNEIVSGEQMHSIVWNGKDQAGKNVSSGIYFYKLSDGENIETRRMLLIK